jgi:hypothetical protein
MNKEIWIVTGRSESGDDYGPEVFDHEPTPEELSEWCHGNDGYFAAGYDNVQEMKDAGAEGPGYDGSYIYPVIKHRKFEPSST